jgi:1-deoxy-D-xylulose-5-phosphate reductoisomerase
LYGYLFIIRVNLLKKHVSILGSTGSIGTQALEVIAAHPDKFVVDVLSTRNNAELLAKQAMQYVPAKVVIINQDCYNFLKESLSNYPIEVLAGEEALREVVTLPETDIVLPAMVGYSGLMPTLAAISAGKDIALANKETLVVAGELVTRLAAEKGVKIIPVDSEHSAIFQCLIGETEISVEKIILTASGGPFRDRDLAFIANATKAEALNHPNWCMGSKITIDSASLMNKGLEAMEAKWLFNLQPDQIEVVIHKQSIIHSLVQFCDGSLKAQLGLPDMRLPIQYALGFPDRLPSRMKRFNFTDYPVLTFDSPDIKKFRNLAIAFRVMNQGGNMPCAMNAANEIAVEAFLCERTGFLTMSDIIEETLSKIAFIAEPRLEDYQATDEAARKIAHSLI